MRAAFLGILLLATPLEARPLFENNSFKFGLNGYYKNLFFASKSQATNDPFIAELNRVRLEGDARLGESLSARLAWDNELIAGDYVGTTGFATRQANRNIAYPDMEYQTARSGNLFYGQNFYRAFVNYRTSWLDATVGRQRIDWGVMRINPVNDLFVRPPIFDLEKDEFIAPTAVNMVFPITSSLRVNPVYTLANDFDRSRTGMRVTQTVWRFDLSAHGGRFLRDTIAGFDFEGDVEEIGFRWEFLYDWTGMGLGKNFFQWAAGFDYGFPNSFYLAVEYFYNGQGTNDRTTPFPATAPFLQTVYKGFMGAELKYDLTPLWELLVIIQNDLEGASFLLNPETAYDLFSWMELKGGAILFAGDDAGEFAPVPNVYYLHVQLFF